MDDLPATSGCRCQSHLMVSPDSGRWTLRGLSIYSFKYVPLTDEFSTLTSFKYLLWFVISRSLVKNPRTPIMLILQNTLQGRET